ncbi:MULTISPECIES: phosphatidylglycerophosphatase B [Kosakonia]|mgnify:FL=1|jgi:phosphatidylglycerophosphatase B|uniref:undecaprenyl-diphosphate phosphatase n=1 Tax=Kosakonia cowanii JCM 10956 = DSM 18146 TaxID=1300165 RepID=A0A807LKW9_9ENTR|nr:MULTISPECIES: phosphatidylglycerophosphatase B [Kosakonia]MDP9766704.1 phosphatidylglycerophosphatase B [Atlantibacter hermannii]APZ06690.1 phosphatidylglycerophosphatase B [Kosakonia cowanii JCM 10956 = DSM 18146]AST68610.1 phosphatidylglycerophosphatase B [Kosakonia cowanii]MBK0016892.1 phosphatidylglycerophosphatase B [Kosakonia sp. S42]MDY0888379.1 phosphatidylglycerophosphatase B [Kosakonia sp. CFBP8986]
MLSIAKRTTAGAAILLIMPLAVWISGWHWEPGQNHWWLRVLFWMTETVTQPWGIITHVVLCAWFLWCLRFRLKAALMLFVILGCAIVAGQGVKSFVKGQVQEPRPFVLWLEKEHAVPTDHFYSLKRKERGALVKEQLASQHDIPGFLRHHWQKETGFAFPSGHTMFAASWALLGVGLLWPRRRTWTIVILLAWATSVMGSRLLLGMHWPRDLAVATLISWILVTLATWLAQRICGPLTPPAEEVPEIVERDSET